MTDHPTLDEHGRYRVPSMADIHRCKGSNGYTAASSFSGAGGACLGLTWAGFNVGWASEFIPAAQEVYRANHPQTFLDTRDIRKVKPDEILHHLGVERGELDLAEGSPPCASFSTSGKREKGWGETRKYSDTEQRVDDLFFEFVRVMVDGLQPKAFIAENVIGLSVGKAKGYLKEITDSMTGAGYRVQVWKLDAQWLGVPQSRKRLIFCGTRNDLPGTIEAPKPFGPKITVRDAIKDLEGGPIEREAWFKDGSKMAEVMQRTKPGDLASTVKPGSYFNWSRLAWGEPARMQIQTMGAWTHPSEQRVLSLAECKRLAGFPPDFELEAGTFSQRWERLAGAVVPPMYLAVGQQVAGWLDQCAD